MKNNLTGLTERRYKNRVAIPLSGLIKKNNFLGIKTHVTVLNCNSAGFTLGGHSPTFSVGELATLTIMTSSNSPLKIPVICRWVYSAENSPCKSGWKIIGEGISLQPLPSGETPSKDSMPDRRKIVRREIEKTSLQNNSRSSIRRFSDSFGISPLKFFPEDLPLLRSCSGEGDPRFKHGDYHPMERRALGPVPPNEPSKLFPNSFIRILSAFRDLFFFILPIKLTRFLSFGCEFVFIAHPRDLSDVHKYLNFSKIIPKKLLLLWLRHQWPISGVHISGVKNDKGEEINGRVIFSPLTAKEMMRNRKRAHQSVLRASWLAYKMGAKVVGLGAFTSIVTRNGIDVTNKIPVHVTTGNALSAAGALQNVAAGCFFLGISLKMATVAIVGAAGNVGSACARLLAQEVKKLILIDINQNNLNALAQELKNYSPITNSSKECIKEANIVLAVTNSPGAVVKPDDIRPGCLVVDSAQPKNVSEEVAKARKDVMVVESAVFQFPGLSCPFDMGVGRGESLGCMTETIVLASKEGVRKNIVGSITTDEVISIYSAARMFGVKLGYFRSNKSFLSEKDIQFVKRAIR